MGCSKNIINTNWYTSFGDLLTLLLCFFLIISVSSIKKAQAQEEMEKAKISFVKEDEKMKVYIPKVYEDLLDASPLDSNLLQEDEEGNYFLKLNFNDFEDDESKIKVISSIEAPKNYKLKLINFKNFKDLDEYFAVKRQLIDADLDVSGLKWSKNMENSMKIMIYEN